MRYSRGWRWRREAKGARCRYFSAASAGRRPRCFARRCGPSNRRRTTSSSPTRRDSPFPPGHSQLPEGIRVLPLPAYSPELNPAEHVGSMLKMATANWVFETLPEMEAAIEQKMRPLWNTRPASAP